MKIAILSDTERFLELEKLLVSIPMSGAAASCIPYNTYDDFIAELPDSRCELTVIALDGAEGMESVRAARILLPEVPLIWLTDDKGFGPESYRLGCAYFSAAPLSRELLLCALRRCKPECLKETESNIGGIANA